MDINKVLALLEKVEGAFSGLYKKLHEDFQHDKTAAQFFFNMHMDEESHLSIVHMEQRIVRASPKVYREPKVNLSEINSCLDNIDKLKREKLGLPELVERLYSLEHCSASSYFIDAIQDTNEDLKEFLLNMGDTCAVHRERVVSFARDLGIKIDDAEKNHSRKVRVGYSDKVTINASIAVRGVDISEGGMFLLTGRSFPIGDPLFLEFTVLQVPITAKAVVQFNIEGVGMGVNFTDIADMDRELIARYVDEHIHEKVQEKDKRVLLVGNADLSDRGTRSYTNGLLASGLKVVDISGFEEAVTALRKGMDLSCLVITFETELDTNYYIYYYLTTLDQYKDLPVLVLTNTQNKLFREKLVSQRRVRLLSRITTSPKRLIEEVKAAVGLE